MTLERKEYLASISDEERAVRFYIKNVRGAITVQKELIADGQKYFPSYVTGGRRFAVTARAGLAISKKMLAFLKKQLPQRLPEEKRCSDG